MSYKKPHNHTLFNELFEDDGLTPQQWNPYEHWRDMPEFINHSAEPQFKITVYLRDLEALEKFGELIGENLTTKTQGVWYPAEEVVRTLNKEWRVEK